VSNKILIRVNFIIKIFTAYAVPFEVGVSFDDQEDCTDAATSLICESTVLAETGGAGGILGFSLCYIQHIPPVA
jgi:hypothetical protein